MPTISCQQGHDMHASRKVHVEVGGPTPYTDVTAVPARFARSFDMWVWDVAMHPVASWQDAPYCPAADCVSEAITHLGTWCPDETTMVLHCLDGRPDTTFYDFGSQLGWFSLLAASCGAQAIAWDAEAENLRVLRHSALVNHWTAGVRTINARVGRDTTPLDAQPIRLAKLDIEGAERDVVRILWPSIAAGLVDHLLVEVTPAFGDYYPQLVRDLAAAGYRAFVLPPKRHPPVDLADPPVALRPYRLPTDGRLDAMVASWEQAMVWFARDGAEW